MKVLSIAGLLERLDQVHQSIGEIDKSNFDLQEMCLLLKSNADDVGRVLGVCEKDQDSLKQIEKIIVEIIKGIDKLKE
jgi:hypothetical protein